MKTILKACLLSSIFILASCAHHGACKGCNSQCDMHKDQKKEQCPMKSEQVESHEKQEAPAKK